MKLAAIVSVTENEVELSRHAAWNTGTDRRSRTCDSPWYRPGCCRATCAKTAPRRLPRQLLGSPDLACGLDSKQTYRWLLVAGRPHSFTGGSGVRVHPSA